MTTTRTPERPTVRFQVPASSPATTTMPPPDSDTRRGRLDVAFRRRKLVVAYVRTPRRRSAAGTPAARPSSAPGSPGSNHSVSRPPRRTRGRRRGRRGQHGSRSASAWTTGRGRGRMPARAPTRTAVTSSRRASSPSSRSRGCRRHGLVDEYVGVLVPRGGPGTDDRPQLGEQQQVGDVLTTARAAGRPEGRGDLAPHLAVWAGQHGLRAPECLGLVASSRPRPRCRAPIDDSDLRGR